MNPREYYVSYLRDIKLMQLATCQNNRPWLCNVWYVMDDQDRVYWISRETRRHSQDLEINPYAACTFHAPYTGGLGEKGQSLVMSGPVVKLNGESCHEPYALYAVRFPKIMEFQPLDHFLTHQAHHHFYQLTPDDIVWFDEINFPDDPRRVVRGVQDT